MTLRTKAWPLACRLMACHQGLGPNTWNEGPELLPSACNGTGTGCNQGLQTCTRAHRGQLGGIAAP